MNRLLLLTLLCCFGLMAGAKASVVALDTVFVQRYDTLCQGDTLKLFGKKYTQTGTFRYSYPKFKPNRDTVLLIHLWVRALLRSTRFDTLCQGEQLKIGNQQFSIEGSYFIVFPTNKRRCDSIVNLQLFVLPVFTQQVRIPLCVGDTLKLGGQEFYAPAISTLRFPTRQGCDSIVRYQIEMLDTFRTRLDTVVCKGQRVQAGRIRFTASKSGVFFDNFAPNNQRCDSLIELHLNVLDTFLTQTRERICQGNSRTLGPLLLTESGLYRYTFPANRRRCDSTVLLDLHILPTQEKKLKIDICDGESLSIGGEKYTRSGDYRIVLQTREGCDSIVNLSLRIRPKLRSSITATICVGEQYRFGQNNMTQTGTYLDTLASRSSGCDSIVRLDLRVENYEFSVIKAAICKGETYLFDGARLRVPGIYRDTLRSTGVCPVIFELNLKVNPVFYDTLRATICKGDGYKFGLGIYNSTGIYPYRLRTTQGCDSVRYLQLKVLPSYSDTIVAPICVGDTFRFGQLKFFKQGQYPIRLSTRLGCDSNLVFKVIHYPVQADTFPVSLCAGDTFRLGRLKYFQTGLYPISLRDRNACDSTLYLQVTRHPRYQLSVAQALCGGRSLRFGKLILTRPGAYTELFRSRFGCDSVVTLQLKTEQVDTSVTQGGILLSTTTATNIRRYEWIDCTSQQVVSKQSSPFFLPERSGRYAVRLYTDTCAYTSGCHSVQLITATTQADFSQQVQSFPNPSDGQMQLIVPPQLYGQVYLDWYSADGRLQRREKTWLRESNSLDLTGFARGLYLLHIRDVAGKVKALVKVVKGGR